MDGDCGDLAELVKNVTQIMIFLPHSQINLWGRKITFFSMDVGFIEEVQLGHPGASLASFSIETVLSQQLKKRTNRFSSM